MADDSVAGDSDEITEFARLMNRMLLKESLYEACEIAHGRGRREGHRWGIREGKAESILLILSARGIELSEAGKARILQCGDEQQIERWLLRAACADSEVALFRDGAEG